LVSARPNGDRPSLFCLSGQSYRVEVFRTGPVERHVHWDLVAPLGEVPGADAAVLGRDDACLGPGLVKGLPRLSQLDLLEAVLDQGRDLEPFEIRRHLPPSVRAARQRERRPDCQSGLLSQTRGAI